MRDSCHCQPLDRVHSPAEKEGEFHQSIPITVQLSLPKSAYFDSSPGPPDKWKRPIGQPLFQGNNDAVCHCLAKPLIDSRQIDRTATAGGKKPLSFRPNGGWGVSVRGTQNGRERKCPNGAVLFAKRRPHYRCLKLAQICLLSPTSPSRRGQYKYSYVAH